MVRTAIADDSVPAHPPSIRPRRFQVHSEIVIGRTVAAVWDEFAQLDHPAWSDHPAADNPSRRVGDAVGLEVGAARLSVLPASSGAGVRGVIYTTVTDVVPGRLVTTETVVTGAFEQVETIQFLAHPGAGTIVTTTSWIDTVPITEARAHRLQHNLRRIQAEYLERARTWTPGTGHRLNLIHPEADDLPYLR